MATIRRPMLMAEYEAVRNALPHNLKPIMDNIEYLRECCWNCVHYDGYEGHAGSCLHFETAIPNEQRSKTHECFEARLTPF